MNKRLASLICLVPLAVAAPAAAQAPSLQPDRSCYGPDQEVNLTGIGFNPNTSVAVSVDGRQLGQTQANAVGEFDVSQRAPVIDGKQRSYLFTATDESDPSVAASTKVTVSSLNVTVTPRASRIDPSVPRRVVARGFTTGRTLWAHIKRGKGKARNVKIGRLKGACHTISAKRRLFPTNAAVGSYRVQFDTKRRYSARTRPNVSFNILIYRYLKVSGSAAAIAESWKPLRLPLAG